MNGTHIWNGEFSFFNPVKISSQCYFGKFLVYFLICSDLFACLFLICWSHLQSCRIMGLCEAFIKNAYFQIYLMGENVNFQRGQGWPQALHKANQVQGTQEKWALWLCPALASYLHLSMIMMLDHTWVAYGNTFKSSGFFQNSFEDTLKQRSVQNKIENPNKLISCRFSTLSLFLLYPFLSPFSR